jgi:WD40 repeat protein
MISVHGSHLHTWDIINGAPIMSMDVNPGLNVIANAITLADGSLATCGGDEGHGNVTITIWDPATCIRISSLRHTAPIDNVVALPDGRILSYADGDSEIVRWNMATGIGTDIVAGSTANIIDDLNMVYVLPIGKGTVLAVGNDYEFNMWALGDDDAYVYLGRTTPLGDHMWSGFMGLHIGGDLASVTVAFHDDVDGVYA